MNENKNKCREVKLAQALNGFMYNFGLEDFYSKLSVDRILQLKQILSDINNIITLRVIDNPNPEPPVSLDLALSTL